jgi:NADH dehydrogenase/NADH:ubiquinone oxidoreductase subunit G
MSRNYQNTLFIILNLIIILTFNILLFSCDELKKSTITKNNILIEITSEPQFFSTVKETLDSFDNGVFVSYDYFEPDLTKSNSESEHSQREFNFENKDFEAEAYYEEYNSEEDLFEEESMEEFDLEFLELEKELEDYNPYDKSDQELKAKLNQMTTLINKVKKGLAEESEMINTEIYETPDLFGSEEDEVEYYDQDNQNSVLKQYAFNHLGETDPESVGDREKRHIKKLSLWTMFNMETEVKFNLNSVL